VCGESKRVSKGMHVGKSVCIYECVLGHCLCLSAERA